MAQVTLQVVVNDSQLNTLVGKVNALDGKKINIGVSGASQANRDVQDIQSSLGKVNGELTKTVETFGPNGKLVKGVNTYKTGINETTQDTQKLNKATGDMVTVSRKVTTDLTKGQKDATNAARAHTDEIKKQGLLYKTLGTSLSNFITRIVAYRAIYGAVQKITQGFTEALKAMKAVDDELVTVRKVTGFSDERIESIKNLSYSTASKYGAEASDYLSAVAAFSRAGYKELATELAELSLKTQIVGDTTQDVANQFLISVDAAYKYKGSVEALSKVLDGANEIDNKYATTIEKIAEGMGIVAPVAAQMHVSIEELTAALGTITAVTQRSGSESARALRALFLNIVGDTKTEIEEGVTWTTGEIAGLQDVIKTYAKDAYLAAQATGGIIDPMRAMEGLSKSLKDGLLTEAELMEMVSDIGGKLRTSQLLALINNWDMYESMLNDYKNAYGSADKEIENAMDSWSRKSAVLKNTWTEFLQKTIKTEQIKKFLDFLSTAIRHTDSLRGVLIRLGLVILALKLPTFFGWIGKTVTAMRQLSNATATLNTTLSMTGSYMAAVVALAVAMYSATDRFGKSVADDINERQQAAIEAKKEADAAKKQQLEESRTSIAANNERIESLNTLRNAYLNLTSAKFTEEERDSMLVEWKNKVAEAYGVEKSALEGVNAERKTGLALLDEIEAREVRKAYAGGLSAYDTSTQIVYGQNTFRSGEMSRGAWNVLQSIYGRANQSDFVNGGDGNLYTGLSGASQNGWSGEVIVPGGGGNWFYGTQTQGVALGTGWEQGSSFSVLGGGTVSNKAHDIIDFYGKYDDIIANINLGIDELAKRRAQNGNLTEDETAALDALYGVLTNTTDAYAQSSETIEAFLPTLAKYNVLIKEGITQESIQSTEDFAAVIERLKEQYSGDDSLPYMLDYLASLYPKYAKEIGIATEETNNFTSSIINEISAIGANEKALDSNATAAERAAAAKKDAEAAARRLVPALFDESNKLTDAGKAALSADSSLASMAKSELEAELAAKQANYSNLVAQIATVGGMAAYARAELSAMGQLTGNPITDAVQIMMMTVRIAAEKAKIQAEINALVNRIAAVDYYVPKTSSSSSGYSGGGSGGGSGGSSSGSSTTSTEDKKLTALKDRISLLKSELSLMQERGDSEDALKAKMREIQKALKAEENYLISIKGSKIDINNLEEEWWSYQNKIQESAEKTKEAEEATAKAIQDAVDAQIALNNAMKERNVHVFNSATGRWEWQADPSAVQSARENLFNAAQNLPDGIRENFVREYGITLPGAQSVSNINGTNNYGNTYNFGSFTLTEDQARSMSVYELARLSQTLGVYGNSV